MQLNGVDVATRRQVLFRGAQFCTTGLSSSKRDELTKLALSMGAKVEGELNAHTTHLVATTVDSAKYRACYAERSLAIVEVVTGSFLKACWDDALRLSPDRFRLDALAGLVVCCTGFENEARDGVREIVERCGATYAGSLEHGATTHLVASEASGAKYDAARQWGLPVVSAAWLEKSAEVGRPVDVEPFSVAPAPAPDDEARPPTAATTVPPRFLQTPFTRIKRLQLAALSAPAGAFLQRTALYVIGDGAGFAACVSLANRGGGYVFPLLSDRVTHVVVAPDAFPLARQTRRDWAEHSAGFAVVDSSWLRESVEAGAQLEAADFTIDSTEGFDEKPTRRRGAKRRRLDHDTEGASQEAQYEAPESGDLEISFS